MKFIIFLAVFVILANAYFRKACAFSLRDSTGNDGKECLKTAVKVVENENADNIGDFHEKSDIEKMKTLYKETARMMENGNKAWRALRHTSNIAEEELGGEEAFLDQYFENYTAEFAKTTINSVKVCLVLSKIEDYYKKAKESIGTTVGASDKFWPMVKDMMTSADLEHTDIKEAPTVFYGSGFIILFGQSDATINNLASMTEILPEQYFRQLIRKTGLKTKPFPF